MNETQNTPPSGPAGNEGPAHAKPGAACRFVPLGERGEGYACSEKPESLQDAFLRFKKSKQAAKKHKEAERKDPKRMQALRERFIATCEKYLGVPYAAKYHPNEEGKYAFFTIQHFSLPPAPSLQLPLSLSLSFSLSLTLASLCVNRSSSQCPTLPGLLWTNTTSLR
eukprot:TRINITY_DN2086_c0_g1_i4.p2 TRINITY_DN2086_c0_g1~~TRINITY_DN2086_c0_g1_i4.p2  ORF type:complete len:167 (-),score=27.98 TRINITY_DN2086_c0_g1_i4:292-792(-)